MAQDGGKDMINEEGRKVGEKTHQKRKTEEKEEEREGQVSWVKEED